MPHLPEVDLRLTFCTPLQSGREASCLLSLRLIDLRKNARARRRQGRAPRFGLGYGLGGRCPEWVLAVVVTPGCCGLGNTIVAGVNAVSRRVLWRRTLWRLASDRRARRLAQWETPAGLKLIDTRRWSVRTLDRRRARCRDRGTCNRARARPRLARPRLSPVRAPASHRPPRGRRGMTSAQRRVNEVSSRAGRPASCRRPPIHRPRPSRASVDGPALPDDQTRDGTRRA